MLQIEAMSGGGGGGGAHVYNGGAGVPGSSFYGYAASGAGGNSGTYLSLLVILRNIDNTTISYNVGSGGLGGTSVFKSLATATTGGNKGDSGGDTSLGTLFTLKGGAGGKGGYATSTSNFVPGTIAGQTNTSVINANGELSSGLSQLVNILNMVNPSLGGEGSHNNNNQATDYKYGSTLASTPSLLMEQGAQQTGTDSVSASFSTGGPGAASWVGFGGHSGKGINDSTELNGLSPTRGYGGGGGAASTWRNTASTLYRMGTTGAQGKNGFIRIRAYRGEIV
jgi:hypothetical protein